MARPPKPGKILELTGSAAHDKKRYARRVEQVLSSDPIGSPPKHWEKPSSYPPGALAEIWEEKKAQYPKGLLTTANSGLLEVLCVQTYEMRRSVGTKQHRGWTVAVTATTRLLGMTPVDEAKIQIDQSRGPAKAGGKLAEFQSRKKA